MTLETQETTLKTLGKQRDSLKEHITGLEKSVGELTTAVAGYKEACKGFAQPKEDLETYVKTKTPMLDAAVKHTRAQIEQCISNVDDWIDGWKKYAKHLEWAAGEAAKNSTAAAAAADAKQVDYDTLKDSAKLIDAKLKELKALRDTIETYDDKNKPADMYFLLKELRAELEKIRIRTPEELELDLCVAWTELSQAKAAARDAKTASDAASEASAGAAKKVTEAVTKRRDSILECINKLRADVAAPKETKY